MPPFIDELEDFLETAVGDGLRVLRVVAPADETDGRSFDEIHAYERDDVADRLDEQDHRSDCIGREALLQLWESDRKKEMFDLGTVRYSVYRMDEAILMMFFEGGDRATIVSVDGAIDVDVQAIGDHVSGIIAEAA